MDAIAERSKEPRAQRRDLLRDGEEPRPPRDLA
jgi:hypothetical protein